MEKNYFCIYLLLNWNPYYFTSGKVLEKTYNQNKKFWFELIVVDGQFVNK